MVQELLRARMSCWQRYIEEEARENGIACVACIMVRDQNAQFFLNRFKDPCPAIFGLAQGLRRVRDKLDGRI